MGLGFLRTGALTIIDYRCEAGPQDAPYPEVHTRYSLSYVRRGSFGCRTRGREHQLLAGGFLIGRPGEEFTCTHEHHGEGDECLSLQLGPELLSSLGGHDDRLWRLGALPPIAALAPFAELAQAAAGARVDIGVDEAAIALLARFRRLREGAPEPLRVDARARRITSRTADWIDAHSAEDIDLMAAAREASLSPWHFLRSFRAVLGITPHQHLLRCRLRKAARRLLESEAEVTDIALDVGFGDVSNFVRTFRRAAGVPPGAFRRLAAARQRCPEEPARTPRGAARRKRGISR